MFSFYIIYVESPGCSFMWLSPLSQVNLLYPNTVLIKPSGLLKSRLLITSPNWDAIILFFLASNQHSLFCCFLVFDSTKVTSLSETVRLSRNVWEVASHSLLFKFTLSWYINGGSGKPAEQNCFVFWRCSCCWNMSTVSSLHKRNAACGLHDFNFWPKRLMSTFLAVTVGFCSSGLESLAGVCENFFFLNTSCSAFLGLSFLERGLFHRHSFDVDECRPSFFFSVMSTRVYRSTAMWLHASPSL